MDALVIFESQVPFLFPCVPLFVDVEAEAETEPLTDGLSTSLSLSSVRFCIFR